MIDIRHCILIYTGNGCGDCTASEIAAGIEEEGVKYEIECFKDLELSELAYMAARESAFGCGIGICGNEAAMQLISFRKGEYVFRADRSNMAELRVLGENAARALKKQPFIID